MRHFSSIAPPTRRKISVSRSPVGPSSSKSPFAAIPASGPSSRPSGTCMPVGRADLHIHTRVSDGLATVEQTLAHIAGLRTLTVVAITDHEDVTGGLRA